MVGDINKYISATEPWKIKDNPARLGTVLHVAAQAVSDANHLLAPFLPHASQKVWEALGGKGTFSPLPHIEEVEAGASKEAAQTQAAAFWSRKDISLKDIAYNFAYAIVVVWVSRIIAGLFSGFAGNAFLDFIGKFLGSQYVWITTISVIVATFCHKQVEKMHGSQEIGTYLIYLFLFVIGVPANIMTVLTKSPLLLVLTAIMVLVNMLFCFVGAKIFKASLEDSIIASNANIGGPTTAAGMAISQGWTRLVGPAMLVGVLGYVIGNYAGTIVGIILGA